MALFAHTQEKEGSPFVHCPKGEYIAVCVDVEDMGLHNPEKHANGTIRFSFEVDKLKGDGSRYIIRKKVHNTMGKLANMRKLVRNLTGKEPPTGAGLKKYDLEKECIGQAARIDVCQNEEVKDQNGNLISWLDVNTMKEKGDALKPLEGEHEYKRPEKYEADQENSAAW